MNFTMQKFTFYGCVKGRFVSPPQLTHFLCLDISVQTFLSSSGRNHDCANLLRKTTHTSPDDNFREVGFLRARVICVFASGRTCYASLQEFTIDIGS